MQIDYKVLNNAMNSIKINGYLSAGEIKEVINLYELSKGTLLPTDSEDDYLTDCYIKRTELAQTIKECREIHDFIELAKCERELSELQNEIVRLISQYKTIKLPEFKWCEVEEN